MPRKAVPALLPAVLLGVLLAVFLGARRLFSGSRTLEGAIIHTPTDDTGIDGDGAVRSVQGADIIVPTHAVEGRWDPEHLERLARTYWRSLTRFTFGLVRVVYTEGERWVCLVHPRLRLLTFRAPEYEMDHCRGIVRFEGGPLGNPVLDIAATTTTQGITATITIGGRAQNPQLAFTSTPNLPQDEVLSRLLFGSSVTNLSATEALQLAAALNSLRGSGGGLNPLGKLRSATGFDRLRVLGGDEATGRGTALAAGKYLTDDIYIEIVTDAKGFTATQLEIALTKALSILSSTGSFGGSNVNLRYSKDY